MAAKPAAIIKNAKNSLKRSGLLRPQDFDRGHVSLLGGGTSGRGLGVDVATRTSARSGRRVRR